MKSNANGTIFRGKTFRVQIPLSGKVLGVCFSKPKMFRGKFSLGKFSGGNFSKIQVFVQISFFQRNFGYDSSKTGPCDHVRKNAKCNTHI